MTQEEKELKLEAEKYARSFDKSLYGYDGESLSSEDEKQMQDFIAGATSEASKKYWYNQLGKEKLELEAKKYIVIKADINDCDYVYEKTLITDEEIVKVKEILAKMPRLKNHKGEELPKIEYKTKGMGNDNKEKSNYNYITYEEKQFLDKFLPIGDPNYYGIHTIVGVEIVQELEKLL